MNEQLSKDLQKIGTNIPTLFKEISSEKLERILSFQDYHGFQKSRLPNDLVRGILEPVGYTSDEMRIEIVEVVSDLRDQVHYH